MINPFISTQNMPHTFYLKSRGIASGVQERVSISAGKLISALVILSAFVIYYGYSSPHIFSFSSWLLCVLVTLFYFCESPADTLTASKIASLLYAASFGIAPVWIAHFGAYGHPYFGYALPDLMEHTALLVLLGYVCFLLGFYLWKAIAGNQEKRLMVHIKSTRNSLATTLLIFGFAGLFSYLVVLSSAGGVSKLMAYSEGRADIFAGVYGGWFWGSHFLFVAYGAACVLWIGRFPITMLVAGLLLSVMFFPFQGRDLVVAPLFCWLIFFHSLRSSLKIKHILFGVVAILVVSSVLGAYRSAQTRASAEQFMDSYQNEMELHLVKVITANVEQFDAVMTAARYVELKGNTVGPMVLFDWVEPLDRAFLGDAIPSINSGIFIDLLVNPEHYGWNTAASPSLPGELFLGMGWIGVGFGMFIYGILFCILDKWKSRFQLNPLLFAAYPFVVFIVSKMIVDGTQHGFRVFIVLLPILLVGLFFRNANTVDGRARYVG